MVYRRRFNSSTVRPMSLRSFSPPMVGRDGHVDGANQLVRCLREGFSVFHEAFQMTLNGFTDMGLRVLERFSLAVTAWEGWAERVVPPRFIRFDDDGTPIDTWRSNGLHRVIVKGSVP